MKKNNFKLFLLTLFCLTSSLVGCKSSWRQPIPQGNIIYMAGYSESGFIQPDGADNQIIETRKRLATPEWSINGNIIFGLSGSGQAGTYGGHPAYWDLEVGRYKICKRDLPFFYKIQGSGKVESPYEVIIQNIWEIVVIDLTSCKHVQTLVDLSDHPGKYSMAGFSYAASTGELVYGLVVNPSKGREYQVIRLDINTGKQVQLAEGINPSWSPDGTQITYLGLDGLYVISSDGLENRKLVNHPFFSPWAFGSPWVLTPFPKWSPDGEWLVYHRCSTEKICMLKDAQIFKVLSDGGVEVLIHTGGEYPSWSDR